MSLFRAFSGRDGRLAASAQAEAANRGRALSLGEIDQGFERTTGLYDDAQGFFQPYQQAGQQGMQTYLGSLGLGGEAGRDQAVGAFQAGPGYQFAMDQGTQAANRAASAGGMLTSGNTLMELTQFGQGLANQEYGNWQNRLAGLGEMGLSTAAPMAQNRMRLGDVGMGVAQQRAGIQSNTENAVGAAQAGAQMAGQTAAQNRLGAVMGGVKTLAGLAGNYFGGQ